MASDPAKTTESGIVTPHAKASSYNAATYSYMELWSIYLYLSKNFRRQQGIALSHFLYHSDIWLPSTTHTTY